MSFAFIYGEYLDEMNSIEGYRTLFCGDEYALAKQGYDKQDLKTHRSGYGKVVAFAKAIVEVKNEKAFINLGAYPLSDAIEFEIVWVDLEGKVLHERSGRY
ncbi:MAG: hypothetical protein IJI68_05185 [Eggerthellaceae bacterium]|nr:hypothetical protein [Eggerthellaceae bacterium]